MESSVYRQDNLVKKEWKVLKGVPMMPVCKLKYGNIYYDDHGSGTAVVMIHPPAMGRKVFYYQKPLAKDCRLILPDLGGHGDTETEKTTFSISDYVKEILMLLDFLGIDQAVLCGYSSGGNIVQEFALAHPDRTMAVILCGGFPEVHSTILKSEHIIGMYMVKRWPKILAKGIASAHTADNHVREMLYKHMLKANRETWFYCYHDSLTYSCCDRLSQLQMPLYLFYGSRDFNNENISYYKSKVRNVHSVVMDKVAHQIITKRPDHFNQEVKRIIKNISNTKLSADG